MRSEQTDSPLAHALRFLLNTGATGIVRAFFSNTSLNGLVIKDMVILR